MTEATELEAPELHPRTARARKDLLAAAVDLLATEGYAALTMDRLAAEARASKQTIYRLWSSKEDLIAEAVLTYLVVYPDPDTGNIRDDLVALVERQIEVLLSTQHGRALAAIWPYAAVSEELRKRVLLGTRGRRREAVAKVIRRGIERGELRGDTDVDLLMDLLMSPAHLKISHYQDPPDKSYAARLVEPLLQAYGTNDVRPWR